MAGTPEGVNRPQPRQAQLKSPIQCANHNGRDKHKRAAARMRQPATAAARTTAKPIMDSN